MGKKFKLMRLRHARARYDFGLFFKETADKNLINKIYTLIEKEELKKYRRIDRLIGQQMKNPREREKDHEL
jgi:hypothetical protein